MKDSILDEHISAETPHPFDQRHRSTAPTSIEPVLYSSLAHIERFEAMLPRWRELKQGGVRFAPDFPFAVTQKGWSSRSKTPLPFLAAARLTLTDTALTLHAIGVPTQKRIQTLAFKLIEQSITTTFENLDDHLDLTIAWETVTNVDWHIGKPHNDIGSLPPTSNYVLVEHSGSDTPLLLQVAPPFSKERIDLPASKLASLEAERLKAAAGQNTSLFESLRARWQAATPPQAHFQNDQSITDDPAND